MAGMGKNYCIMSNVLMILVSFLFKIKMYLTSEIIANIDICSIDNIDNDSSVFVDECNLITSLLIN